jgi:hypothetical protein
VNVLCAALHESAWLPGLLHTAELLQVSYHILYTFRERVTM